MFSRTAVTLGYSKFVKRTFPAAMKAVGPSKKGGARGSYLKKVQREIARRYAKLSAPEKKRAIR